MSDETMQVADPTEVISTEPVVVDSSNSDPSVMSEHGEQVDADLTWDNVEDAAPMMADATDDGEEKDDWDRMEDQAVEASAEKESVDAAEVDESSDEVKVDSKETEPETSEADKAEVESKDVLELKDMADDTKIMAKVDGELQEISIKEFKNGISGEKALAQRFTEFDNKEKSFDAQMKEVNDYVNDLGDTMRNASVMEGVSKIGELTGMPSYQIKEALIKELLPEIERRYSLDDNELQLEYQQKENEYLKNKSESDNTSYKAEQAQRDLQAEVDTLRETHNIEDQEWDNAITKLDASLPKDQAMTPELVTDYVQFKRAENRADSIIDSFDPKYREDSNVMDALVDEIFASPNLSDDDFADILKSALGTSKKEDAQAKVDEVTKDLGTTKKVEKEVKVEEEYEDWDDLLG
jgi:hypothetical protein